MTDLYICPRCNGAGEYVAHHNTDSDSSQHYWDNVKCYLCNGDKMVSEYVIAAVQDGQRLRVQLREHGFSLRTAANNLGISVPALSSVLCGRITLHAAQTEALQGGGNV